MITLPEHVLQADEGVVGFSWDGMSPHPQIEGRMVPNKETTMDWAEHQRITFNAGKLLVSWTAGQHAGNGKKAFKALKDAFDGSNKDRSVLRVSKGIHQPETNPHLQIRVVTTFHDVQRNTSTSTNYTFHLNVGATEIKGVDGLADSFQWEGVQFTYEDANVLYRWPLQAVPARTKNSTPSRRASISYASLVDHMNDLAEKEKQRLRLEKEEKARLQATSLEESIKLDLARLEKEDGVVLRKLRNEPPDNFWKGKTKAFVVNQYKKGYYVIWDPQKMQLTKTI